MFGNTNEILIEPCIEKKSPGFFNFFNVRYGALKVELFMWTTTNKQLFPHPCEQKSSLKSSFQCSLKVT